MTHKERIKQLEARVVALEAERDRLQELLTLALQRQTQFIPLPMPAAGAPATPVLPPYSPIFQPQHWPQIIC